MKFKQEVRTKTFWFILAIAIPVPFGIVFPSLQFLSIPYVLTIFALLPAAIAVLYSSNLAARFVKIHKKWHRNKALYSYADTNVKMPPSWKFALKTTAYSFAIIYNIITWTGAIDPIFSNPNKLLALIGLLFPALFVASAIHVAIYLLTKSGLMFEDKEDGSRINLGREMASKLDWAISPTLLMSLIYAIVTKPATLFYILTVMLVLFMFCLYAAFVSFYMLKKWRLNQLTIDVRRRLNNIINIS